MATTYKDEAEIQEVVRQFEECAYGLAEFTHARHLTVACCYLCTSPPETALVRMRQGLQHFLVHHGRQGYHETITRFWMELLGNFLAQPAGTATIVTKINCALERYASKETLFEYYSRERVMSDIAKAKWIEPDLQPLSGSTASLPGENLTGGSQYLRQNLDEARPNSGIPGDNSNVSE